VPAGNESNTAGGADATQSVGGGDGGPRANHGHIAEAEDAISFEPAPFASAEKYSIYPAASNLMHYFPSTGH